MKISFAESLNLAKQDTLFIHGNLASSAWWQPTLREWRVQGSLGTGSLLFADWRGCGKNPISSAPFTLEELARDYLSLLDRLGKREVALVGHSLGGLIAMQMMILEPHRFAKAILLDPVSVKGVVFDESMYTAFRQMEASRELTGTVLLNTVRNAKKLDPDYSSRLVDDAFHAVKGSGPAVLEILKTLNLTAAAEKIKIPSLILHGAHDQVIPLKDSQDLARILPASELEILPDAGHCWNIENPVAFASRIRAWL